MPSPSLATVTLSFLLAGVGGWAVNEVLHEDRTVPVASVAQTNPAPIKVTIVTPGSGTGATTTNRATAATTGDGADFAAAAVPARSSAGQVVSTRTAVARRAAAGTSAHRLRAAAPTRRTPVSPTGQLLLAPSVVQNVGGTNVIASNGAIVYIGDNGHLIANTGQTSSSGVVALGVNGSDLGSGDSQQSTSAAGQPTSPAPGGTSTIGASDANGTFASIGAASGGYTSVAVSGFEDHSVSVVGDNQITTYDDSNVFINRDGNINANTGDTDSSGLNAVDVTGSIIRSGNSGDGEGADGEDSDDEGAAPAADAGASREDAAPSTSDSSDEEEQRPTTTATQGRTTASVTDEGASTATGGHSMVVGADGYDDVSIRSHGNGNVTSYDDSNVVIGGSGNVNAQIGDSDTGGAVVMGVHNSDVRAGCEGDLCYSGSHR